jgi:hypothetical protein
LAGRVSMLEPIRGMVVVGIGDVGMTGRGLA